MTRNPTDRTDGDDSIDRRTYLQLAGATAGAAALAGCGDLLDGGSSGDTTLHFGYGGGPFLLSASTAAALAASESEPNDACANANPIDLDTDVGGTLESAGVDWYSVDLSAGDEVDVLFDRVPSTGVTNVVLYGPDCTFLTLRQVGTDQQIGLSLTAEESGTHYVEVADVEEAAGDYAVRVDTGQTTATPSPTPTDTATATPSPTDTATATPSPTPTATATPSPTATATSTPTATATATDVADEYGEQGYGEYGYGGVA